MKNNNKTSFITFLDLGLHWYAERPWLLPTWVKRLLQVNKANVNKTESHREITKTRPSVNETQRRMRSNRCIGWKGYRV